MRPIPKSLLIHEAMLHKLVDGGSRWDENELDTGKKLSFVRMESSSKVIRDKNNAEVQLAATLFYDCKNSKPRGVVFKVYDVIIFNGEKHKIQVVEPLYDDRKLHHYELGLIKHA